MNSKGETNEAKGAAKEMKGKLRGDLGDATDNAEQHSEGRGEQMKGKIQKNVGKAQQALDPDKH